MATITANAQLDTYTGTRTAGESWTISNGAILTVKTDTRWHAKSPASMTGTLGALTLNTPIGGTFFMDATAVRWMPFDTGSGTVPAIGTTITQGAVSGYLLGVWADYTSAPTAAGAAMPATGYLKFREVTGGPFAAGALTGISANATSADVTGWIEVVFDSTVNSNNNGAILTEGYKSLGGWFELGTTNGSAGQILQAPTNGGGNETRIPGIQVETSPGSGVYEWWCGCYSTPWTTATAGIRPATDGRTRLYQVLDNGQIRFGHNGTVAVGYTPPSGCKVRIPNIFIRAAQSASRATNYAAWTGITSGPRFSGSGRYNFSNVLCDVGFYAQQCFSFNLVDSAVSQFIDLTSSRGQNTITNVCRGDSKAYWGDSFVGLTSTLGSTTISNIKSFQYASGTIGLAFAQSTKNVTISDAEFFYMPSSVTTLPAMQIIGENITLTNFKIRGLILTIVNTTTNCTIQNLDFIERIAGDTTTTGSAHLVSVSGKNILIDTITWGNNGEFANCHPRATTGIVYINTQSANCRVRNLGAYNNFLNTGATANTRPTRILYIVGGGSGSTNQFEKNKMQRMYVNAVQQLAVECADLSGYNTLIEQVHANTYNSGPWPLGQDFEVKGIWTLNTLPSNSYSLSAGTYFMDMFNSSTTGRLACIFPFQTAKSAQYVSTNFSVATSGFTGGTVALTAVGDYIITETPYRICGHTGFVNTTPSITSSGTHTFQYDIDTGSGYSGTWQTLNGANLSAHVIDPVVGFKFKLKITCTVASTSNYVTWIFLNTTSTSSAQFANLYPLDSSTLTFTGLVAGSEVRCYTGSDPATAVEIGGTESSGTSFSFTHSAGGTPGFIRIFALGYQPVNYDPYTYSASDTTLLVQQTVDRNYVNPA